jgi:hypothetical protein
MYAYKKKRHIFHHEKLILDVCLELRNFIASVIERYKYFVPHVQSFDP